MRDAWENTYVEGYLSLTLDVVKQVVHDGKKNHILVSMIVSDDLLWDEEVVRTFSVPIVHQAGITIGTRPRKHGATQTHLWRFSALDDVSNTVHYPVRRQPFAIRGNRIEEMRYRCNGRLGGRQ
jgi:hypothetical protein